MALTMQDRIDTNDSPTQADLDAIRKQVEACGDRPVMDAATVLWLVDHIEFLNSELSTVSDSFGRLKRTITGALKDFEGDL